jgi:hypothetical protein
MSCVLADGLAPSRKSAPDVAPTEHRRNAAGRLRSAVGLRESLPRPAGAGGAAKQQRQKHPGSRQVRPLRSHQEEDCAVKSKLMSKFCFRFVF